MCNLFFKNSFTTLHLLFLLPKKKMSYELIIFDCDGVLVDSEELSNRVFAEEARKLGSKLTDQEAEDYFAGTSLKHCMEYVEKELGKALPKDFEETYRQKSFEAFERELQPVQGIRNVLEQLNIPFCVASNGPASKVEFNLKLTGLFHFFEPVLPSGKNRIFSAYDLNVWKPDPTLFLTAAKTMNTHPSKCLVVEDSPSGVKAGVAAGMMVLGYAKEKQSSTLKEAGARIIFPIGELMDHL